MGNTGGTSVPTAIIRDRKPEEVAAQNLGALLTGSTYCALKAVVQRGH